MKVNPYDALSRFLTSREATGLSPRSLRWYDEQVSSYLNWLQQHAGDWCSPDTVDEFLAHERRRQLADSTIQARYRALSAWFTWLVRRKFISKSANPIPAVDRPKISKKRRRYVSLPDFARLYQSIQGDTWLDYRDREILLLMQFSGLRVSEVTNLVPADVDVAERLIHVRNGKGGDDRDVPCPQETVSAHVRYLMARPAYPGAALFVSHDGYEGVRGTIGDNGIRQMLRRRCQSAGLEYYNPHSFRHGFAMLFLNAGMTLSAVSEAMGHSSEQTTRIYARWLKEGLAQAYEETIRRFNIPGIE